MNLAKLKQDLTDLDQQYQDWHRPLVELNQLTWRKRHEGKCTELEQNQALAALYRQQLDRYNPWLAQLSVRETLLRDFVKASPVERADIRRIVATFAYAGWMLLRYMHQCAECIETAADTELFRSGLVAAAIENYSYDFRDTHHALSELAIAAREVRMDIEPHSRFVAQLCAPAKEGSFSMRRTLEDLPSYALAAIHLMSE